MKGLYLFLFTFAFWGIEVPPSIIACQSVATFESIPCITLIQNCFAVPVITTDLSSVNYIARRSAEIYKIKIEMIRWLASISCATSLELGYRDHQSKCLNRWALSFYISYILLDAAHFRKKKVDCKYFSIKLG